MTDQIRATIRTAAVKAAVHAAAAKGLTLAAEHLLTESRAQVPIDTGALERSGVATVDDEQLRAAVAYDTPYAVRQHENLTYRHDQGRKAKYLEDAMNQNTDTLGRIIANQIEQALQ